MSQRDVKVSVTDTLNPRRSRSVAPMPGKLTKSKNVFKMRRVNAAAPYVPNANPCDSAGERGGFSPHPLLANTPPAMIKANVTNRNPSLLNSARGGGGVTSRATKGEHGGRQRGRGSLLKTGPKLEFLKSLFGGRG
jgi:hypothetical protein